MKSKFQRLIWCIVIFITLINLIMALFSTPVNVVLATDNTSNADTVESLDENAEEDAVFTKTTSGLIGFLDGVAGVMFWVLRIAIFLVGSALEGILAGIAKVGGSSIQGFLTPDDIFFNRVEITEIDFFNFTGEVSAVKTIRMNIATWYYILRVLSIVLLLAVLIYIGIRMAVSTVASEQAQYKRMLTDWVVSFALVFLLNYIIMFTIEANNAFVNMLSGPARTTIGRGIVTQLEEMSIGLHGTSFLNGVANTLESMKLTSLPRSVAALMVYFALIGMTAAFLFIYIKRMLIIGFLIIISPLITVTYSIDKVKDGKAQALNTWLKEFMSTVLMQPFDCIIYLVFISAIMDTLKTSASLTKLVLAIMCMKFIWEAEKIVKKIFNIQSESVGNAIAAAMTVNSIGKVAKTVAGTAAGAISKTKFGQNVGRKVANSAPIRPIATAAKNFNGTKVGGFVRNTMKESASVLMGGAAASFEMGANTPANAMQVGVGTYSAMHSWMFPDKNAVGSKENIKSIQNDLNKFASYMSKNNNFNFQNYGTNQTSKNNLRSYVNSLIGVNMQHLDASISAALNSLILANPTEYDTTTTVGMNNLHRLQDMAMDPNLDFTDPGTNPLGHAWTTEEMRVVSTIQTKNLATAVNSLHDNYEAAGSNNAKQDVDTFINSLT